jgi:hypothetical protein
MANHGENVKEHYGNPRLVWGYYPLSADYNSGGCVGNMCGPDQLPIDPVAQARAHERTQTVEQRGGNNPIDFQEMPAYTQHEVGTGCYNANCHCKDCHYDCMCDDHGHLVGNSGRKVTINPHPFNMIPQLPHGVEDAFTWLAYIAIAVFLYKLIFKRK